MVRRSPVAVALLALAFPLASGAAEGLPAGGQNPARCARFAREIVHYEQMAGRAQALGNREWRDNLETHVDLLRDRAEPQCPELKVTDSTWESFRQMLRLAGSAALTYFTMGAF
jgi:hypothetical protein